MKRNKKRFSGFFAHPVQKVIISFVLLITTGALLLLLPCATTKDISVVDAIFTSTSAVCVTGLIVCDTATRFTLFGKIVIILLIQLGGLGIMTFSLGLLSIFGGDLSIKWRFTFEGIYSELKKMPIKSILIRVLRYTFVIELTSAALLFTQFYKENSFLEAAGHSLFHAISAFCNAGFSTFSNNLEGYKANSVVNLTVGFTIILGGLGFIVMSELVRFRIKKGGLRFSRLIDQFSIHTRLVLLITALLIIFGMASFYLLEYNNILKDAGFVESILISFFQSVTARTAGFNTVNIGALKQSTCMILVVLMFIGGSPGSIAGGVKTTTIGVIFLLLYSRLRGREHVLLWERTLDRETVDKSATLGMLSMLFVGATSFLVLVIGGFEAGHPFLSVVFEDVSAFGTVGLTMGVTTSLPDPSKIVLSLVMLVGRLGPLTLITALTHKNRDLKFEYPAEHIMIG
ncbi:MAG: TrkH family potassium uptake protein [Spirochaetes bacterium]|jgi:trk system potassium uptake protein TrkH|nr:TrkH family potassium uptake protein [Spirochaetota bacterium]